MKTTFLLDVFGLFVIAMLVAIISKLLPETELPSSAWVLVFLVWAACGMFIWHHPKAPKSAKTWILYGCLSVIVALVWFCIARYLSHVSFKSNEPDLSEVIDVSITLLLAPGLTVIAVVGWIRLLILNRSSVTS